VEVLEEEEVRDEAGAKGYWRREREEKMSFWRTEEELGGRKAHDGESISDLLVT